MSWIRALAILIAAAAVVDPAVRLSRPFPAPVRVHMDRRDSSNVELAARLEGAVGDRAQLVEDDDALADVVIGNAGAEELSFKRPLHTLSFAGAPDVGISEAPPELEVPLNAQVTIPVRLRGHHVAGTTSALMLEEQGIEIARTEHRWQRDGEVALTLPYLAVAEGARRLTIRIAAAAGERHLADNRADLLAKSTRRAARVAILEARPSWGAGFVRRNLSEHPAFRVASAVRSSTGIATRAGEVPAALTLDQLARYEVVVVGAPEELRSSEVDALRRFAALRGGTVVLLADRTAKGPYTSLLPGVASEQLWTEPHLLQPAGILASEISSVAMVPGMNVLAAAGGAPVVFSWPIGEGRLIFSGALDAWRYRADPRSKVAAFWREQILSAAIQAPPMVNLTLAPAVVRPGESARVVVRLRASEYGEIGRQPVEVEARVADAGGRAEMIRLVPTFEPGTFEGVVTTSSEGAHAIDVSVSTGSKGHTVLLADPDAATLTARPEVLDGLVSLTGGAAAGADDLSPLVERLSTIPRPSRTVAVNPMRSPWWLVAFVILVCTEWTLRRSRGLR